MGTLRSILRRYRLWAEIQRDVRMLPTIDDVGRALPGEEESALLSACLQSRSRALYTIVMLPLNTGMRRSEIRLLRWMQIDFTAKMLTVGKSKTQTRTGRTIPLNARILSVLKMWAAKFPDRQPSHYVFPFEKCGAKGEEDTFGFTAAVVFYKTDPTRPIGDWKEAWEKAKERAGAILTGKTETPRPAPQQGKENAAEPTKKSNGKEETKKPEPLKCRFHDLRHTAVTRLLEAGIPYPVVATIMGWSTATTIRMAKRYGHIGNQALRDAAEVLGRTKIPRIPKTSMGSLKKSPKSIEVRHAAIQ